MKQKINTYQIIRQAILYALLLASTFSFAQTALPTHIRENTVLSKGVYIVTGTHYVKKGVTLTIEGEAALVFQNNATIRVDGGLEIQGTPNKLINITSIDKQNPGNGIVINGVANDDIVKVNYARFDYIKKPMSFEFRWARSSVDLSSNVFRRSIYEGAAIEIKEIDNLLTTSKIYFSFKDNTFSNSTSSVLLSNITSDLLTIDLDNNVITRNEYTGRIRNGIFTSPLYLTYNQYQSNDKPTLDNNSIFDNFYSLYYEDTFDIGLTNISVVGNSDKMELNGNYFGDPEKRELEETFDFISANYQAPFLYIDDPKTAPSSNLNGHFYEVKVNGDPFDESQIFSKYKGEVKDVELRFNRPVVAGQNFGVVYHYLQNDTIRTATIRSSIKFSDGNKYAKINLNEKITKYGEGYLEIDGLYDSDGMNVPILSIGKKTLKDEKLRTLVPINIPGALITSKEVEQSKDDSLLVVDLTEKNFVAFERLNDSFIHVKAKYWDAGVFVGNSLYFGDVNRTAVSVNPRNMRPNGGLRFGYQATERFRVGLMNNYMLIAGADQPISDNNNNPRGTDFSRNLSFRTTIIDLGITGEYNLTKFKRKTSIVPSLHAGVNAFYFKPMARVPGEDEWYDLRKIGTEGQTLENPMLDRNGDAIAYKKIMVGIPFGASLKRHITQHTILKLSYTYNKIFTDYLDDISTGEYPDADRLQSVNIGIPVGKLANPSELRGQRSFSDDNDGYGYWGLSFIFKIY